MMTRNDLIGILSRIPAKSRARPPLEKELRDLTNDTLRNDLEWAAGFTAAFHEEMQEGVNAP